MTWPGYRRTVWVDALLADGGWYADFGAGPDHVVLFAGRVFRYQRGRAEAMDYSRAMGVPEHQLDWLPAADQRQDRY